LLLARPAEREDSLRSLLERQQEPGSADFHRWMTPTEFGLRFGPTDATLQRTLAELRREGFTDLHVSAGRTVVEMSGNAAAVEAAFGADIHSMELDGSVYYANQKIPVVPDALRGLVEGVVSLNDVGRSATASRNREGGNAAPQWTLGSNHTTYFAITPSDFAALYNVFPLWNAGVPVDGSGQTIAVVGDTDIDPTDFTNFRTYFGMPLGKTTSQTGTQYLNIIYNGPKPAVRADEFHADSDTQWAAAIAKGAVIDYVASESTEASSGNDLSAAYIVDNNLGAILVDSYSSCEQALGRRENSFYNMLWQQAAAQGITVVTATGDSGSSGCDAAHVAAAAQGDAVNGIASTGFDVAVGGTDFYAPQGLGAYFSPTNSSLFGSVSGYIPEIPWNDTCTNPAILAKPPFTGDSAEDACNSDAARSANLLGVTGTGGGASSLYAKPSWQVAPGVPGDGKRDVPDVALFASQGRSNSFYVVCQQSRNVDGKPCNLDSPYSDFAAYGGTEIAAPAFAGILALAAQKTGSRLGNANYTLYKLAAKQAQAGTNCNSTGAPASGCLFHDVTAGTNAMPCVTGTTNCVTLNPAHSFGVSSNALAGAGYDTASGLGSVDAANLVNGWGNAGLGATTAVLSITPSRVVHGSAVIANVTVAGNGVSPLPTGQVSINSEADSGSVGFGPLANGGFVQAFQNLPGGTYGVIAHYSGDSLYTGSDSNFVSVTVLPEPSATTLKTLSFDPASGSAANVSTAPYGTVFYIRADVVSQSGQGIATGNMAITDNGSIFGSGVYRLNSSGYTEAQNNSIAPGQHQFSATYSGDPSLNASAAATASLTITRAPTVATLSSNLKTVSTGGVVTLTTVLATQSFGFEAPSGTVAFYAGNLLLGTSTLTGGSDAGTFFRNATATLTVSATGLPVGGNTLSALYAGDFNYLGSRSSAETIDVVASTLLSTVTSVVVSPMVVAPSATVTFTATVAQAVPQAGLPAIGGAVQFVVDGHNTGAPVSVAANGIAVLTTSVAGWLVGPHLVLAVYAGDQISYRSSTSDASPFLIAAASTVSVPVFLATPQVANQGTFISVATSVLPASPVATGTVQLVLDGGPYGAPIPLGNAAATLPLATSTLQIGKHILTVFYSGDNAYAPSYALPATITILAPGAISTNVTLSNLAVQIAPGNSYTFTASVSPSVPTPTGVFQVIVDGGSPGSPVLLTAAAMSLSIPSSSLPLGPHTVQVFYSGDATYNFSRSAAASFSVEPPVPIGTFTLSPVTASLHTTAVNGLPQSQSLTLTLASVNGYSAPVTLTCGNLPAYTQCTISPATVNLQGVATATATLTVSFNTGIRASNDPPANPWTKLPMAFAALLLGGFVRRRRRLGTALLSAALILVLGAMSGCGNSFYQFGATPTGTYPMLVTAMGGATTRTATIDLQIQ
jgi:hypothetical protein